MSRAHAASARLASVAALFLFALSTGPVPGSRAAGTPPPKDPAPPPSTPASAPAPPDTAAALAETKARAQGYYKKGWKDSEAAKAALKAKKDKDAAKKFAKALKSFEEAVKLDPANYEAWNMVGFCSRKTGDLKKAFAAYEQALTLNPDYEEAHEYLGEAYLMSGDIAKAKEQLAWLKEKKSEEAAELQESIDAAEKGGSGERAGHHDDD